MPFVRNLLTPVLPKLHVGCHQAGDVDLFEIPDARRAFPRNVVGIVKQLPNASPASVSTIFKVVGSHAGRFTAESALPRSRINESHSNCIAGVQICSPDIHQALRSRFAGRKINVRCAHDFIYLPSPLGTAEGAATFPVHAPPSPDAGLPRVVIPAVAAAITVRQPSVKLAVPIHAHACAGSELCLR